MSSHFARRGLRLTVLLLLAFAVAACGSRVDEAEEADGGLGGDPTTSEAGAPPAADATEIGTIANPCSDEAATEGEIPADAPGVSEDEIRIGVISDRANDAVPLPTVGIEEGVRAFVEFCNAAGGINGRQLVLEAYDSKISALEAATTEACRADLFAIVGSGSVQDQQAVATRVDCGLPEIAAYSATSTRAESEDFFQPVTGTLSQFFNTGPCREIAKRFPEAVKSAAIVYTGLPAAQTRGEQIRDICGEQAGIEYVVDRAQSFGDTDFRSLVADMKANDVKYFTMVSAASETLAILEEIDRQGLELEVIDLGQQYYDSAVGASPLTDGAYVLTNTVPFSEADDNPVLGLYLEYLAEAGGSDDQITTLGVQAFSAGLLFATAADAIGNELSREALVTELEGITSWDGGGLHMETNPGERVHNDCFLYMRIVDGEFVREFPESGFECNPDNVVMTEKRYES